MEQHISREEKLRDHIAKVRAEYGIYDGEIPENLFKKTRYELVTTRDRALKLITNPQFKSFKIYNKKLVGVVLGS